MQDVRLVYYSESRLVAQDGPLLGKFQAIQRTSETNNRHHSITGALAFDDIWFLQTLEGEREAVWSTFRTIMDDPRHDEIVLVECLPIESRCFGDWAMRLVTPAAAKAHLAPFKVGGLLRPQLMSGDHIVTALAAMIASEKPRKSHAAGKGESVDAIPGTAAVAP